MESTTQRKLNRQCGRNAERRLLKGRFPFPWLLRWARSYFARYPETFISCDPGDLRTNISGEVKTYTIQELYELLLHTKAEDERQIQQAMEQRIKEELENAENSSDDGERPIDGRSEETGSDSGLRREEGIERPVADPAP